MKNIDGAKEILGNLKMMHNNYCQISNDDKNLDPADFKTKCDELNESVAKFTDQYINTLQ